MHRLALIASLLAAAALAGCDMLGLDSTEKLAAARDADGRAIGGACRHAGRAIEDCYALNRKAERAAVFAGWRDMNDYMRENKIEPVAPQIAAQAPAAAKTTPEPGADAASAPEKRNSPKAADAGKAGAKSAAAHDS